MKYILYARKSTEDKGRQVLSLESQITVLKEIAQDSNISIVQEFTESKSAKKPNNRPFFAKMIEMLEQGEAQGILCWKIDRLSRNPVDSGTIQWLLQQGIIQVIQTSERQYLPDDNALIFNVESGMANQYIRDLSKNVKRGLKTKLEKGGYPSLAKIGYLNDVATHTLVIDSERAPYIKRAFELYATGTHSLKKISEMLYEEGFRSRGGNKLFKGRIHSILKDPLYYGTIYFRGKYYAGIHEPIISKELFDKAQEVMDGKGKSRYQKRFFPLRGFMRCHVCDCLLTAMEKKGFVYYYCTNGKGKCEEHKSYMRSEQAAKELSQLFSKVQFDKQFIEICYEADLEKSQTRAESSLNIKERLEKRLKFLGEHELRLLDIQLSGKYPESTIDAKLEAISKEAVDIQGQLKRLDENSPEKELRTLEQVKNIFLSPYLGEKDFLEGDELKQHSALEKLLLNAFFQEKKMALYKLKQPYQILAAVPNKADFSVMRGRPDSNRRPTA